ncbi:hypothetical protein ANO11243_064420 [Dothideomycetidae sp. 11243]|nr:hypothetical protein ANO11243_064420 [fungal sp. No.11243]
MDTLSQLFEICARPLAYLGLSTATILSSKLAGFAWLYIRPTSLSRYQHGKPGSTWALVTGASDGIGLAFTEALLQRGFNVIMHGRNKAKLERIVSDLQPRYSPLEIRFVIADASALQPDIAAIQAAVKSLPGKLTILVNNVGGTPFDPSFRALSDYPPEDADAVLNMNARFPVQLTRALLPIFYAATPALVMNIGSAVGELGMPFLTTYSASKSFNHRFNNALRGEMAALGIDVEVIGLLIGNVLSAGNRERDYFTCTSAEVANEALNRVGCGSNLVWAWWRHAIGFGIVGILPVWIQDRIVLNVLKSREDSQAVIEQVRKGLNRDKIA